MSLQAQTERRLYRKFRRIVRRYPLLVVLHTREEVEPKLLDAIREGIYDGTDLWAEERHWEATKAALKRVLDEHYAALDRVVRRARKRGR